jgi:polyisoprenoid-binding protein YceI
MEQHSKNRKDQRMKSRRFAVIALVLAIATSSGAARAADTYQIDPVHSFASFSVGHLGIGLVRGFFSDIAGMIIFDEKDAAKSSIEVAIKTASVNTHVDKRDEDLRSPNFFEVDKYPTMTFTSTKVAKKGKGYAVTGDFSLHGVTRRITVEAKHLGSGKDPWGGFRAGFVADFSIKRSDFGMKYDYPSIPDKVDISVAFEAVKK